MQRRLLLSMVPVALLAACGFELRKAPNFPFSTLLINGSATSGLVVELKRQIESSGTVKVVDAPQLASAQAILDVVQDQRERVVVGIGTAGQVREFQLRVRFRFRVRTLEGKELIPSVEILLQRDISYSESAALSKEAEEALLYRDMQSDIVQQVMRRLAAIKEL